MKKFTQTTLIALLIGTFVFAQKGSPGNQAAPSQTTVIVGALRGSVILLSPADGKLFNGNEGSKPVLFRWTAIVPKPKEAVTYRLKVWQLMQGQNAVEAMRNNQPIVTKDVVNITQAAISNLYTGPCKPPYLCDFVWAVEVLNSEGNQLYANSNSYSFKYTGGIGTVTGTGGATVDIKSIDKELENTKAVKAEADNKGNAGNTGMSGGKSLNANGDTGHKYKTYQPGKPVYGNAYQPTATHPLNLPIERIIHDADGNVVAMAVKTKNGGISVLVDEVKLLEFSKNQAVKSKMTDAACLSALQNYLHTGDTRASGPGICWVWVNCNTPGHMPGCGSMMPIVCDPAPIFK